MSTLELNNALESIKKFCISTEAGIAVAESVTSGLLQNMLGSTEEASRFFEGGITTYNCIQKMDHLLIPYSECSPCKGIALEIANKMAIGICDAFNTNIGLSLTGYASPIPELEIYDLFAYGAIAHNGKIIFSEKLKTIKENPEEIKIDYCIQLLVACSNSLEKSDDDIQNKNLKFFLS